MDRGVELNMKIIKPGLMDSEGIGITCPCCYCEYIIEDRSDFVYRTEEYRNYLYPSTRVDTFYATLCPSCKVLYKFGFPEVHDNNLIFQRDDWEDRFEIQPKLEELNEIKDGNLVWRKNGEIIEVKKELYNI